VIDAEFQGHPGNHPCICGITLRNKSKSHWANLGK